MGSLLPSKVWLHAAHERTPHAPRMSASETEAAAARVREAIATRVACTEETLRNAGVEIIGGSATILTPGEVSVVPREGGEARRLTADSLIIATGSEPIFTPSVRPSGDRIIAPRFTKDLKEIPESLIMVGGGITGVEYSEAFARLGSRVTLFSSREIVPSFYRPYTERLTQHLRALGVEIRTGQRVREVATDERRVRALTDEGTEHFAEMAFIATGRAADLTLFGEDAAELRERITDGEGRFITVDEYGRTSLPGVYACGDATGPPFTANRALWQGRQVAAAVLGALPEGTPDSGAAPALIEAIFTDPQLAQVGRVPEEAPPGAADSSPLRAHRRSWASSMLHTIHGGAPGELTVWTSASGGIHGAAAYGRGAAEVLAPLQLALNAGISWTDLSAVPFAYPTLSEIVTS